MRLRYKLSYFLIGFAISSFAVVFILNKKNTRCSYFPNDRVLNNIRTKSFHFSKKASTVLAEEWVDTIDIRNTLQYGDVDFDRSNIKYNGGKLYTIIGKTIKNQPLEIVVENYENRAVLKEIKKK